MADEVKNGLSADASRIPSKWNRNTVADGDWLQKKTLNQLSARDVYLAEQIDKGNGDVTYISGKVDELSGKTLVLSGELNSTSSFLSGAIDNVSAGVDFVSAGVDGVSSIFEDFHTNEYEQFVRDVTQSAADLDEKIDNVAGDLADEIVNRTNADNELQNQIDKLEAATDVICVYGTYSGSENSFSNASGDLFKEPEHLTENDVIKVLNDNSDTGEGGQTYWQATNVDWETSSCTWNRIGKLEPYYTKSEINTITGNIASDISNTYLSAKGAVHQGKNIVVTEDSTKPEITISTSAEVEFTTVSSNGFSGTNISGINQYDTIDNLFGSAYSGAEASAWIYDNSARLDIQAGYGLEVGINDEDHLSIGMKQYHCTAGGYDDYSLALGYQSQATAGIRGEAAFAFGYNAKAIGAEAFAVGYDSVANASWAYTMGNAVYADQPYSVVLGFLNSANASGTYQLGRGLSSDNGGVVLGQWNEPLDGATLIVGDGTGTQIGHDVVRKNALVIKDGLVSGRDFSAGNVSLSSLTNISAFGNGITNTETFNLSAVKLSAGDGIGFKKDTNNVLSITAAGTTYQAGNYISTANNTIAVTGTLINSAQSGKSAYDWITTKSSTLQAGAGIEFYSAGPNILGIRAEGTTYSQGRCIKISSDNSINLSANVSANSYSSYEGATTDYSACTLSSDGIEFIRGGSDTNRPYYRNALDGTAINIRYDNKHGIIEDVNLKSNTIVYSQTATAPSPTFSVTGNWSNIISASKLKAGSGIEIFHYTNNNAIYLTANKYTYQTTAAPGGSTVVIDHEETACSSLEFRATYPVNPTEVPKNVTVLYNNTAVGCLIPTPPSYSYGQHNNYYLAAKPAVGNSPERHWEPVSSITANCISGDGTITAMVISDSPQANSKVLYLV